MKLFVITTALCLVGSFAQAQDYDIVILNGRVMDPETNFDTVANVGINNGYITKITSDTLDGARVIDATGHVVAPGFIDFHSHGQDPFTTKVSLRGGVTSPLELEVGASPVSEFYEAREGKSQANYGVSAGHAAARLRDMDGLDNPGGLVLYTDAVNRSAKDGAQWMTARSDPLSPTREEIKATVEEDLKQGGIGLGFPVGYYTAVSSEEITDVSQLANQYDTFILTHVRYLSQIPPSGYLGIQELLSVAKVNDVPLIVQHIPSNCLALTGVCLDLLSEARESGMKVAGEFYPYMRGSSIVGADYLGEGFQERTGMDYSDITMVATNETLNEETYTRYRAEEPGATMIMNHIKEEDMLKAFADPFTFVGADGFPYTDENGQILPWDAPYEVGRGHPRGAGTHARILRLARERDEITLMQAVAKLSFMQADFIDEMVPAMRQRGRVQEGMIADITVFNPDTVTEKSDYNVGQGALPSTGIPYVVVNGVVVVDDSRVLPDVFPGQPIRNPVIE